MAIIYTYPVKSTPANDDLILISDSADSNKTKQVKVSDLPGGSTAGVSSITISSGTSSGNALVTSAATGGITLTTNVFAGAANVGHVPSSASAAQTTTFLRADGSWSSPAGDSLTAGTGIDAAQLSSDIIQADLFANGGLVINGQEMQVDLSATAISGNLKASYGGTGVASSATYDVLVGRASQWDQSSASNSAIQLPVGTTAQQPTASASLNGLIRYNSTTNKLEAIVGGNWLNITTAAP